MFYVKLYVHSLVDEVILQKMHGATIRFINITGLEILFFNSLLHDKKIKK